MEKSGLVKCVYLRSTSPGGSVCIVEKYPRNRRTQTGKYCFPPSQKCPKVGQHNAVMVCKCNLHLDGKKNTSVASLLEMRELEKLRSQLRRETVM